MQITFAGFAGQVGNLKDFMGVITHGEIRKFSIIFTTFLFLFLRLFSNDDRLKSM